MCPSQVAVAASTRLVFAGAASISPGPAHIYARVAAARVFSSTTARPASEEEFTKARQWYKGFSHESGQVIPRTLGEVSYSRSSGPGGQNVNKVNSKAQLRVPAAQLLNCIPPVLHPAIRASRHYADKTDTILIQADDSRKAGTNKDTCYRKLSELVDEAYRNTVPGETSADQKQKVQKLKKAENEGRLKLKKKHSSKKAGRSKGSDD